MPNPGSSGLTLVAYYAGSPVGVSTTILEIPKGTIVIDYTNAVLYQKTSTTDNSTFTTLTSANTGTFVLPTISGGLLATGSVANDFSGSTGPFLTSTGASTFGGSTNTFSGGPIIESSIQTLTGAGAINVTTPVTLWVTTGAQAGTLADGTNGQIKKIVMKTDGGDGTLTPTTKTGYSTIVFNDAGDAVILQFFTTIGWIVLGSNGPTIS